VFKLTLNGWRWHADQFAMAAFLIHGCLSVDGTYWLFILRCSLKCISYTLSNALQLWVMNLQKCAVYSVKWVSGGCDECCASAPFKSLLRRDSNMGPPEYEAARNVFKTHFDVILHLYPDLFSCQFWHHACYKLKNPLAVIVNNERFILCLYVLKFNGKKYYRYWVTSKKLPTHRETFIKLPKRFQSKCFALPEMSIQAFLVE